jgi:hypothetical protein
MRFNLFVYEIQACSTSSKSAANHQKFLIFQGFEKLFSDFDKDSIFVKNDHVLEKSVSSNLMLSPQPQASITLGFLNLKPDSSRLVS